jgi:Rrf2 family protein
MRLSTKSEYGTRAMLDLAVRYKDGPVLMKNISKRQDITFKYLGQIFLLLKKKGLIVGQRGSNGGYQLSRPPKDITLLEIFETLEGPLDLIECATDASLCTKSHNCVTHDIWKNTRNLILDYFSSLTLEDLVEKYLKKNITCEACKGYITKGVNL